mmetsp:Transcript_17580/g.44262  ORF Transcript_17580/g.44262 Transcript_17580/m.44262 type:complete len:227 (-) Transcript_17580:563-1243(-)
MHGPNHHAPLSHACTDAQHCMTYPAHFTDPWNKQARSLPQCMALHPCQTTASQCSSPGPYCTCTQSSRHHTQHSSGHTLATQRSCNHWKTLPSSLLLRGCPPAQQEHVALVVAAHPVRVIKVRDVQVALGVEDGQQQVVVRLKQLLQLGGRQRRVLERNVHARVRRGGEGGADAQRPPHTAQARHPECYSVCRLALGHVDALLQLAQPDELTQAQLGALDARDDDG